MTLVQPTSIRDIVIALLRIILGVVFIFASIEKIADPGAFASAISSYRVVSSGPALLIATILPWIELLCGFGLLVGLFVRGSALLVLIMLTVFTVAVLSALWRGMDISCGCYSQDPTAGRIGWRKLGENAVLITIAFVLLLQSTHGLTLERFIQRRSHPVHT